MPAHLTIRPVREDDAPAITALLTSIVNVGGLTIMTDAGTVADQLAFIRSLPTRGLYHVALASAPEHVVGIQDVLPVSEESALQHVGAISTFVVTDRVREGIGRRLMNVTVAAARAAGYGKLIATIRADNPGAVAFYESQGFRVVGVAERHAMIDGRYVDEVITERWID